jgi:molybdopterin/thiamine biosynthesis adenylyltransferase
MDFHRQLSIFNPETVQDKTITVIGTGAIGSAFLEAATRVGFKNFIVYDDDVVNEHNLPNQLFFNDDIGKMKVDAIADRLRRINPQVQIERHPSLFMAHTPINSSIVVSAPDNMRTRQEIFQNVNTAPQVEFFLDARMGGTLFTIYPVPTNNTQQKTYYEQSLYTDAQAKEMSCTAKAIIYNVFGVASEMVCQLVKYFQEQPLPKSIVYDYQSGQRLQL